MLVYSLVAYVYNTKVYMSEVAGLPENRFI